MDVGIWIPRSKKGFLQGCGGVSAHTGKRIALEENNGEKHSAFFSFGDYIKDAGYPTIRYMSQTEAETLIKNLLPPPTARL